MAQRRGISDTRRRLWRFLDGGQCDTIIFKGQITKKEQWHQEVKITDAEKPHGKWNKVEVIVNNGKITHRLNGVLVNEGSDPSIKEGQILLQSEGAEVYYRNVVVEEL